MAKNASSSADFAASREPTPEPRPLRKRRATRAALARSLNMVPANSARDATSALDLSPVKPLLIGVGIGAALVGTAMALRSRADREGLSPFHGPNSALAGALTKTALLAVARAMSGETIRTVATRALLEVAEAWKA